MPEYRVRYEIDVEADSPLEAADKCCEVMKRQLDAYFITPSPTSAQAPVFDVFAVSGDSQTRIDLDSGEVKPLYGDYHN